MTGQRPNYYFFFLAIRAGELVVDFVVVSISFMEMKSCPKIRLINDMLIVAVKKKKKKKPWI